DCSQEPFELPPAGAKRPDVADRAHRHFDEAAWILKRLSGGCGGRNIVDDGRARLFVSGSNPVPRILAADPCEAQFEQHLLQVFAIQAIGEAAGRAETTRSDAKAFL